MILQLIMAVPLWAAPVKQVTTKVPVVVPQQKWYRDLSLGAGLDFRRQTEINKNDTDFNTRFVLHADRLWNEKWLSGVQYSYDKKDSSSGAIGVQTQNHEILARGLFKVYSFTNSAIWVGLSGGFDKNRIRLSIADSNQLVRWSDWQWILAPEVSHRHPVHKNIWLQEVFAYTEREFSNEGEWSFALRLGVDLSVY